jgi:broad specificity phosphatase PhoE
VPQPTRLTIITYPDSAFPLTFPGLASLDERAVEQCRTTSTSRWPTADTVWCAPEPAARQAADAFGLTPVVADALALPALGRWAGQSLDSVAASDSDGLAAWLSDPACAPHGGESLAALVLRLGEWLDTLDSGRSLIVVHAITGRAAATHALAADPRTMMHLDVPPLGLVRMTRTDRWRLQRLGRLPEDRP